MADHGRRFRRADRLRRAVDFQRVFRHGQRADGRLLSLVVASGGKSTRLGLAAGRRVGGAVQRNRVKRLVREGFRMSARPSGLDVVVLPKAAMVKADQAMVAVEYSKLLERLRRRLMPGRREPPAVAPD